MKHKLLLSALSASIGILAAAYAATTSTGASQSTAPSSPTPAASIMPLSIPTSTDASTRQMTISPAAMAASRRPFIAGVQTHFAYASAAYYLPDRAAALVNALGVNGFRDDIYWNSFAPDWDLQGSHLPSEITNFWSRTAARPLLIVNNGNSYISGTSPPLTEEGRSHFAGFAARVAAAGAAKNALFEIWNEWNMNAVKGRANLTDAGAANDPRAALYYAPLAQAAGRAIRAKAPAATILVAASGDDEGWPWTREVVRLGGAKYADGLSVHLYNHCQAPQLRNATEFVDRLDKLRATIADLPDGKKPIYVTEFGWPTGSNKCAVSQVEQGNNVAQFYLWAAATPWIGGAWYYQLKDSGQNWGDIQDNFGLYDYRYLGKFASCTTRESMALINSAQSIEIERPYSDMFVLKIRTAWGYQIVSWTSRADVTRYLRVGGADSFYARRMCGDNTAINNREVSIGSTPVVFIVHSKATTPVFARR